MTILLRIAERLLNRPLLVHPDKVPLILGVLQGRIPIGEVHEMRAAAAERIAALPDDARAAFYGPAIGASRFFGSDVEVDPSTGGSRRLPYRRTAEGVAILTITGSLVDRGAWLGSNSGETSYEGIKFQLAAAAADPKVQSILLDISSPGGEATGAFEAAAAVRAASAQKPVVAVVNGMAASAAYAIAAGARKIVTTETGVSGSIGVVLLHADYSRALDKEGVTPTLIFAGAHKVDGNPFAPLPDGVKEDLQREVNHFYDLFVQTVAAGRKQLSPAQIRGTEARVFIGAEAVTAGIADEVGTFESALADLSRGGGRSTVSSPLKGPSMTQQTGAPAADTAGISKADHDAAVRTARAEGKAEGTKEAASAERSRIKAIQGAAFAGQDALVTKLIDDGASAGDAALALNADFRSKGAHLESIKAMDTKVAGVKSAPTTGVDPKQKADAEMTDVELTAKYEASPDLKAEFPTAGAYLGYVKGVKEGRVRILNATKAA